LWIICGRQASTSACARRMPHLRGWGSSPEGFYYRVVTFEISEVCAEGFQVVVVGAGIFKRSEILPDAFRSSIAPSSIEDLSHSGNMRFCHLRHKVQVHFAELCEALKLYRPPSQFITRCVLFNETFFIGHIRINKKFRGGG